MTSQGHSKLREQLNIDTLDDLFAVDGQGGGLSPLTSLSPNAAPIDCLSPMDSFGALPRFNKPKCKRDPRRQSSAILGVFDKAANDGSGLLDENEILLGDEDIQIPLAKSGKTAGVKNTLWVDPDVDDELFFDKNLPQPELDNSTAQKKKTNVETNGKTTKATTAATAQQQSTGTTLPITQSVALNAGFAQMCQDALGLNDIPETDMPEMHAKTTKVKEMATLIETAVSSKETTKQPVVKKPATSTVARKPTTTSSGINGSSSSSRPASRIRPPSSSSAFFSHTTTSHPAAATNKPTTARPPPPSKPTERPAIPASKTTATVPQTKRTTAPSIAVAKKSALPAPKPASAAAAKRPPASTTASSPSKIPTRLAKPTALLPPKSTQQRRIPPKTEIEKSASTNQQNTSTNTTVETPKPAAIESAAQGKQQEEDVSPATAHLRWLEEHPELAFGGGSKIALEREKETPKKKTALEMQYEAWGDDLEAFR